MKDPSPATAGTVKPKRLIIDIKRRRERLQRIGVPTSYDPVLWELSEIARDVDRAIERGVPGAVRTGGEVIRRWAKRKRYLAEMAAAKPPPMQYRSSEPRASSTRTRSNVGCKTTPTLPRSRSREQSHAPRRAPKAAQRSGDSGDSSDPPGSSSAALAAALILLLRMGVIA